LTVFRFDIIQCSSQVRLGCEGLVNGRNGNFEVTVPSGATVSLSVFSEADYHRVTYSTEATVTSQSIAVLITSGVTDNIAPTCTAVNVSSNSINSGISAIQADVTLECKDEVGGSGLWNSGFFYTVTVTSGHGQKVTLPFVTRGGSFVVPPYVEGTVDIVGVYAIDKAGNAALYGSCGCVVGYDSLGCSPCRSNGNTVVVSFFAFIFLILNYLLVN